MRPTLFEMAGGETGLLALVHAHHTRCLADEMLNHPFSKQDGHPQHLERLAAYWCEVLGGPTTYSDTMLDETSLERMHAGNGDMSDLGRRFVDCFVGAMDDVRMPDDPDFRAAMRAYMEWATTRFIAYPDDPADVPDGLTVPRWGWDGLGRS
jgi:hemoglobin